MSQKNYGPAVSGYLDPDGRAWETAVYQAGKPVLDKELNLAQDIDDGAAQRAIRLSTPSGWISPDLLGGAPLGFSITAPNIFTISPLTAHVNGWIIQVTNTSMVTDNQITLPAAPVGAGTKRTDVVILEVWRKLISASPSTDGKSFTGRIWLNGNVKVPIGSDAALNPADDILDAGVGAESTKRVQIQYRLRVISGVDIFAYPYVLNDPAIFANSSPTGPAAPDGVATIFPYVNQAANGDPALWRAGDGNPANALNTVDGYVYAMPLIGAFRRNQTAFDRNSNQNGAGAFGGPSGRPDGRFYDLLDGSDLVDFRVGVSPTGWDYSDVLRRSFQNLLDNDLNTEWTTTLYGGGVSGHTFLFNDEIGISNAHGGDGIVTGSTPGGPLIGEFDAARRVFSDRAITEVVTVRIPAPLGGWLIGSTVTIDPTALPIYPYAAFNWASYNPAEVLFMDIVAARWSGAAAGKKCVDAMPYIGSVSGLGADPVVPVDLSFFVSYTGIGLTDEPLDIDILVAYPSGQGLTYTPTSTYGTSSITVNNPAQLPAAAPVAYSALAASCGFDNAHREVQLQYTTVNQTITLAASTETVNASSFIMPERVNTINTVLRNGGPLVGGVSLDSTGRIVTFSNAADYTSPGDVIAITYSSLRPLPQNDEQISLWYQTRAPQTVRSAIVGTTLSVIPRYVSDKIYTLTVGSGSPDEAYPFPYAYVQTGGVYPTSAGSFDGEHMFNGRAEVATATFNAATGFLQLPVNVPYSPDTTNLATFTRGIGDTDVEGRTFFKNYSGGYVPNAYAQDLSDPTRHKVILPVLVELPPASPIGMPGQLALMLLIRGAFFDERNNVVFNSDLTQNTTVASVFRIKGNLLSKR
jgi:hypothetical protein